MYCKICMPFHPTTNTDNSLLCVCVCVYHQNQHDDLKKQYYELQERHQLQDDEHNKAIDEHKQRLDQLHQNKESEISKLKGIMFSTILLLGIS